RDGKLLWRYAKIGNRTANCCTPIITGNHVFCASGYGGGLAFLELTPATDGKGIKVVERYFLSKRLPSWHETTVQVGDHAYASVDGATVCMELLTGKILWQQRTEAGADVSVTCAEGHLYLRSQQGKVLLIAASPKGYVLKGSLQVPDTEAKRGST